MHSAIFQGEVGHYRMVPHQHGFRYKLYMLYLDLAELPVLFDRIPFWSACRPALAWFRREDHVGDPSKPLDSVIRELIHDQTGKRHCGPIRLLTHLRYFGVCMNPVSFYYCCDDNTDQLRFVVAEVHNTPWNETHCYVLDCEQNQTEDGEFLFAFAKSFHVSPFMPMDQHYRWQLSVPANVLRVRMDSYEQDRLVFNAVMKMERIPVSKKNLMRVLFSYPLMTTKVLVAIYWQALKLWSRKTPFFPHPKHLNHEVKR